MRGCLLSAAPFTLARLATVAWTLLLATISSAQAAEFGSSPYSKGFRDIYAGVVPSVPGLYILNDVYHYDGKANALAFNGAVQVGVEAKFTADFLPITYVTKRKVLWGTGRTTSSFKNSTLQAPNLCRLDPPQ
jgi:hypothetical protein